MLAGISHHARSQPIHTPADFAVEVLEGIHAKMKYAAKLSPCVKSTGSPEGTIKNSELFMDALKNAPEPALRDVTTAYGAGLNSFMRLRRTEHPEASSKQPWPAIVIDAADKLTGWDDKFSRHQKDLETLLNFFVLVCDFLHSASSMIREHKCMRGLRSFMVWLEVCMSVQEHVKQISVDCRLPRSESKLMSDWLPLSTAS